MNRRVDCGFPKSPQPASSSGTFTSPGRLAETGVYCRAERQDGRDLSWDRQDRGGGGFGGGEVSGIDAEVCQQELYGLLLYIAGFARLLMPNGKTRGGPRRKSCQACDRIKFLLHSPPFFHFFIILPFDSFSLTLSALLFYSFKVHCHCVCPCGKGNHQHYKNLYSGFTLHTIYAWRSEDISGRS